MEIQRLPEGYDEMIHKLRTRMEDAEKRLQEKATKSGTTDPMEAAIKAIKLQQAREGIDRVALKNREVQTEPSPQIKSIKEDLRKQAEEESKIARSRMPEYEQATQPLTKGRVTPGAPEEKK